MADGTILSPGVGGDTIYDEDVGGGVKVQGVKIILGDVHVNAGPVTPSNPFPVLPQSGTAVLLSAPPTATNAGSATTLTFASTVNHVGIQNNGPTVIYFSCDGTAANLGDWQIPAGSGLFKDVRLTSFSLYTAGAVNINGATGGNIVVTGEA